jgi:8-oxo-dGTP diphosphatase
VTTDNKSFTLDVLVHLEPTPREGYQGSDEERPLNDVGHRQAERLAQEIGKADAVFSSPAARCRESVEPLAKQLGVPLTIVPEFRETGGNRAPDGWGRPDNTGPDPLGGAKSAGYAAAGLAQIQAKVPNGGRAVLCSYGDIVPVLLAYVAGAYGADMPSRVNARGARYTIAFNNGRATIESHDASADFPK